MLAEIWKRYMQTQVSYDKTTLKSSLLLFYLPDFSLSCGIWLFIIVRKSNTTALC